MCSDISHNIFLCSTEEIKYDFGTTRGYINDDRIFIFGKSISVINSHINQTGLSACHGFFFFFVGHHVSLKKEA